MITTPDLLYHVVDPNLSRLSLWQYCRHSLIHTHLRLSLYLSQLCCTYTYSKIKKIKIILSERWSRTYTKKANIQPRHQTTFILTGMIKMAFLPLIVSCPCNTSCIQYKAYNFRFLEMLFIDRIQTKNGQESTGHKGIGVSVTNM